MTDLPTAEWCREAAEVLANAAASMLKPFEDDPKYAAALRIAARVLDADAEETLARIIYPQYGEPRSAADTARIALAYLRGDQ